jgi:hypothetical protein
MFASFGFGITRFAHEPAPQLRYAKLSRRPRPALRPREAEGRRRRVAFSLVTFSWRKQEKVTCCRATPGNVNQSGVG